MSMLPRIERDSQSKFDSAALSAKLVQLNPVLIDKIKVALGCGDKEALDALQEVLRFMFLVSQQDEKQLTPSHCVDLAWHEFILFTKPYQEFCQRHFARMIHHFPGGLNEVHKAQFVKTLRRYESVFGKPDPRFWGSLAEPPDADCGACESF